MEKLEKIFDTSEQVCLPGRDCSEAGIKTFNKQKFDAMRAILDWNIICIILDLQTNS